VPILVVARGRGIADPAVAVARVFAILACVFVFAAVFHAAAFVQPAIAEPVPRWWHALFVGVNLALAVGVWKRPRWLPVVFALYVVQQFAEHAPRGVTVWRDEHRIDWASLGSIAFVPVVLGLLVVDAAGAPVKARGRARTASGPSPLRREGARRRSGRAFRHRLRR
jgi:hypothetical protein